MNKRINVLVDGVGGDVGQGVLKALIDSNLDLELFAACVSSSSSWLHKIKNSFIFPYVNEEYFIEFLIEFLNKHQIDVYFPTVDSTLVKISQNKELIENQTKVKIFIDSEEKIEICDDKLKTNEFLIVNGFDAPKTINLDSEQLEQFLDENRYPLILKTRRGNGSKNIFKIDNYEQLKPFLQNKEWILQEYLNTYYEITSGIYIGDDKEIKGLYVLKRTLKCGSTFSAERIIDPVLDLKLSAIAEKMGMKYLNIQATYQNNRLLPFEFNGRLSGTTGAMRYVFNAPEMFIKEKILQEKITPSNHQEKIFFTRYNEEVIYTQHDIDNLLERSRHDKK